MHWLITTLVTISVILPFGYAEEIKQCGTPEAIQESLQKTLETPINCDESLALESIHLFELIKCHKDIPAWNENIGAVLKKLKENKKENSISGLFLLGHMYIISSISTDVNKEKLLAIKNELPEIVGKIFDSKSCGKINKQEGENKYKLFTDSEFYPTSDVKMKKFVLNNNGSLSVITDTAVELRQNVLLIENKLEANDYEFDFPVTIENGDLEEILSLEEGEVADVYSCIKIEHLLAFMLSPLYSPSVDYCHFAKFIDNVLRAS